MMISALSSVGKTSNQVTVDDHSSLKEPNVLLFRFKSFALDMTTMALLQDGT